MSERAVRVPESIELPGYRVTVAPGSLANVAAIVRASTGAHRFALITDANVRRLYARPITASFEPGEVLLCVVPPGEQEKTRERWASLTDEMLDAGLGRDAAVIALGGGVIGDLAGFVAATYMRGIPCVQVPTTLLAMIDASVGGKTGVDTPAGKNLVGAFHRPAAVLVDPLVLDTLPDAHLRAGLAEAIKHGAIADRSYFDYTVERLPELIAHARRRREPELFVEEPPAHGGDDFGLSTDEGYLDALTALIARSIEIKAGIVRQDERESGLRKTLNLGHTIGHAVELLSGYAMLHGEAVAIGMVLEARLAERMTIAEHGTAHALREAVRAAGLPASLPPHMPPDRVLTATRSDKKARRGAVEYALPRRIGAMAGEDSGWAVKIPDDVVLDVLGGADE